MSMMVSFVLSFFPRGVLDEIFNLIESVSEGFPSYFSKYVLRFVLHNRLLPASDIYPLGFTTVILRNASALSETKRKLFTSC